MVEDFPEDALSRLVELPLAEVRGMRNRLAHGYGDIDSAILWETMHAALPSFIAELSAALSRR